MAIFKMILRYHDNDSGLDWSITNHRTASDHNNAKATAEPWNTAYLGVCSENVRLVDGRFSDINVYRDQYVFPGNLFAQDAGQIPGESTEIASYAQWRGNGGPIMMAGSAWKLHGVSEGFVDSSRLVQTDPAFAALLAACLVYFQLYRPVAGAFTPSVSVPADFPTGSLSGMYFRRLGRPFGLPGQSH